jgi:hypothetical protein
MFSWGLYLAITRRQVCRDYDASFHELLAQHPTNSQLPIIAAFNKSSNKQSSTLESQERSSGASTIYPYANTPNASRSTVTRSGSLSPQPRFYDEPGRAMVM